MRVSVIDGMVTIQTSIRPSLMSGKSLKVNADAGKRKRSKKNCNAESSAKCDVWPPKKLTAMSQWVAVTRTQVMNRTPTSRPASKRNS